MQHDTAGTVSTTSRVPVRANGLSAPGPCRAWAIRLRNGLLNRPSIMRLNLKLAKDRTNDIALPDYPALQRGTSRGTETVVSSTSEVRTVTEISHRPGSESGTTAA